MLRRVLSKWEEEFLPEANAAGIKVDKIGFGIIANPTPLHLQGVLMKLLGLHSPEANIYGPSFHVPAALGNFCTLSTQLLVGFKGAETGDHLKSPPVAKEMTNGGKLIQEFRVDGMHFACSKIFEKIINFSQRCRVITINFPVADIKLLSGVGVKKREGTRSYGPKTQGRRHKNCCGSPGSNGM